jgi:hypothetical protein
MGILLLLTSKNYGRNGGQGADAEDENENWNRLI